MLFMRFTICNFLLWKEVSHSRGMNGCKRAKSQFDLFG